MATNQQSKRPATTLRCGNIKATIWQNVSEKGPFFATTFSWPIAGSFQHMRDGASFGLNDLTALLNGALEAKKQFLSLSHNADPSRHHRVISSQWTRSSNNTAINSNIDATCPSCIQRYLQLRVPRSRLQR